MSAGRFDTRGGRSGLYLRNRRRTRGRDRAWRGEASSLWPWRDVDPDAPVPEDELGGYYGGGSRYHVGIVATIEELGSWEAATVWDSGTPAAEGHSLWLRSTAQVAYWDAGAGAWVYDSERAHEVIARCHGWSNTGWDTLDPAAASLGVVETEGIYAALVEGSYYWYAGDPTRPGEDVMAYRLVSGPDEAAPPWGVVHEWLDAEGAPSAFVLSQSPFAT